jgi:hypothetical protein
VEADDQITHEISLMEDNLDEEKVARPCHVCTGTALTLCQPHLRRDWAHPCHICTGTGLIRTTPASGLRSWQKGVHVRA